MRDNNLHTLSKLQAESPESWDSPVWGVSSRRAELTVPLSSPFIALLTFTLLCHRLLLWGFDWWSPTGPQTGLAEDAKEFISLPEQTNLQRKTPACLHCSPEIAHIKSHLSVDGRLFKSALAAEVTISEGHRIHPGTDGQSGEPLRCRWHPCDAGRISSWLQNSLTGNVRQHKPEWVSTFDSFA